MTIYDELMAPWYRYSLTIWTSYSSFGPFKVGRFANRPELQLRAWSASEATAD